MLQLFSFDRCVSRLLEMQSEEYINGCAPFREANIRSKNAVSSADKWAESHTSQTQQLSAAPQLPYSAEASLNLQDVAAFYSPWDLQSRQLHLHPPSLQLLLQVWKEVEGLAVEVCAMPKAAPPVPPSLPHSHAKDNIIIYLNALLDSAAHQSRLPLSMLDTLLERLVHSQTGVLTFAPARSSARQLSHLLELYDLVPSSAPPVGGKHKYHFRRRGRHHEDDSGLFDTFSFNAFVAAIHKHPIVTLL